MLPRESSAAARALPGTRTEPWPVRNRCPLPAKRRRLTAMPPPTTPGGFARGTPARRNVPSLIPQPKASGATGRHRSPDVAARQGTPLTWTGSGCVTFSRKRPHAEESQWKRVMRNSGRLQCLMCLPAQILKNTEQLAYKNFVQNLKCRNSSLHKSSPRYQVAQLGF